LLEGQKIGKKKAKKERKIAGYAETVTEKWRQKVSQCVVHTLNTPE